MARLAIDDAAWRTPWRRRCTGEKALLALGLLAVAVTARHPVIAVTVLAVAVAAAVFAARVPPRIYLRAVAAPALFVVIGVGSIVVSVGSRQVDALWQWGPLAVTHETLSRAVDVAARSFGAIAALMLLATTTPVVDLLNGLRRLRIPEVIIEIASVTYRLIFSLLDSQATIRESQAARLGYATTRAARGSVGQLGAATLIRAWTRAQRLEAGLAGRGYAGSLRTLAQPRPVSWRFILASVGILLALAVASALSPTALGA